MVFQLFTTDRLTTQYPDYFVNSPNPKNVSVISVYLFEDQPEQTEGIREFRIPKYVRFYADFVKEHVGPLGQYVCMANEPLYHKRKYRQVSNPREFTIWFTDYKGTKIELTDKHHFIVELLLEY